MKPRAKYYGLTPIISVPKRENLNGFSLILWDYIELPGTFHVFILSDQKHTATNLHSLS